MKLRRNLLMQKIQQEHGLPDDYQQIDYLQSNGEQYIDTDYIPKLNQTDEFYVRFSVATNSTVIVFGTNGSTRMQLPSINYRLRNDLLSNSSYFGYCTQNDWVTYDLKNWEATCNGTAITMDLSNFSNYNAHLFLFAQGTQTSTRLVGKISEAYYKEGDDYAFNLVPCYRKVDSKPGMYDLIRRQFYTNAGTGEFVVPT